MIRDTSATDRLVEVKPIRKRRLLLVLLTPTCAGQPAAAAGRAPVTLA